MFLHIGGNIAIPFSEVILILNYDAVDFDCKEENNAKSVVVTRVDKKIVFYYSDINAKTLTNRFECFLEGAS